jgi:hypothetical protein
VVHPEVGDHIVKHHVPAPNHLSTNNEEANHSSNARIAEHNQRQLLLLEQHAILTKVEVRELREPLVVLLPSQVGKEVPWPPEKLVLDAHPQRNERGVLSKMRELHGRNIRLLALVRLNPALTQMRHESSILINIPRSLVVSTVADSPAVERDEEEGVHDKTHDVVEFLVLAESAVSALVCQDPDPGEHESLDHGVGGPGDAARVGVGDVLDVGGGVGEGGEVEVVAHHVGHGAEDGGLEAVRWDGVVDHLHGVGGQLKDLAVLVDVLSLLGGGSSIGGASCGSHDWGGGSRRRLCDGERGGDVVEEEGGRKGESVKSSSRCRRGVGAGLINSDTHKQISDSGAHGRWVHFSPQ